MKSYFNKDLKNLSKEKLIQMIDYYRRDDLTGFYGRKDFEREFHEIFHNFKNEGKKFYLSLIDINGLHQVNREEGYFAGDNLIKKVASCISYNCNGDAYRIGGDELAILSDVSNVGNCKTHEDYVIVECSSDKYKSSMEMFKDCDQRLIEAKAEYYKTTGKDRRGRS